MAHTISVSRSIVCLFRYECRHSFFVAASIFCFPSWVIFQCEKLIDCLIGTGIPHGDRSYENYLEQIDSVSKNCAGLRRMGAASIDLAYVASGKLDGFWEKNLNIWDVSAGVLLIREAGGKITEPDGNDWTINSRDILASNLFIHSKLQEKLTLL